MSKAISPAGVAAYKAQSFPDYVFEAFNELIAANFSNGYADVKQKDVIARMMQIANDHSQLSEDEANRLELLDRSMIFARGYLNVEEVYREQGWKVAYDKPAYNESYDAYFTFKAK